MRVAIGMTAFLLAAGGTWVAQGQEAAPAPAGVSAVDISAQSPTAPAGTRLAGAWKNLKYLHTAGGSAMYGIDALLIIGVAFVLERALRMTRKRILPAALLKKLGALLDQGDAGALREAVRHDRKSTLGKVLLYLADAGDAPREEREATVNELASRDLDLHRMMCFPLAAIAGLTPLIGLLGTVVGIRECFRDVALAGEMGNPAMLAGGIEKALLTTIYGLIVAITTLFAFNLFKFRINLIANELEEVLSMVQGRWKTARGGGAK